MLILYKVGNEKEARLNFNSILEVETFLNGVYDQVKGVRYSDGILFNCYTTEDGLLTRSCWILSMFDSSGDKIDVKDWE